MFTAQLLFTYSLLIKYSLSGGPFSIGGKCVESSIINNFDMNKVRTNENKQKQLLLYF